MKAVYGSSIHVSALMRPFVVVWFEVVIQIDLHLINRLVPFGAPHHAEVLVQKGFVQPFDEAITLGPSDFGGSVLDLFKLQEQLIGMIVRPAAEFAAIVAQNCADPGVVLLEER